MIVSSYFSVNLEASRLAFCIAVSAVDWFSFSWFEGNLGLSVTVRADSVMHLTWSAKIVSESHFSYSPVLC